MGTAIVPFEGKHAFANHCDFCAKSSDEALCLIASANGSHICEECVDLCGKIVALKRESDQ